MNISNNKHCTQENTTSKYINLLEQEHLFVKIYWEARSPFIQHKADSLQMSTKRRLKIKERENGQ